MHQADRHTESGSRRQGIFGFKGTNIIDHLRTGSHCLTHDDRFAGIDRNRDIKLSCQALDDRDNPVEFFVNRNPGGAGTGRFSADIEYIGAFGNQVSRMGNCSSRFIESATVGKRIERDVDDAHDEA